MPPRKSQGRKKLGAPKKNAPSKEPMASETAGQVHNTPTEACSGQDQTKASKQKIAVAFSLGTEHATVILLPKEGGQSGQVIANEDGERHIPCIVSFVGEQLIAGTAAKTQMVRNIEGSVRFFVPLIGLKFDDEKVQYVIRSLPIPVEKDENGFPIFVLSQNSDTSHGDGEDGSSSLQERRCTVPELITVLLKTLKQSAGSYIGADVDECFLSHPLDFQTHQIEALKQCAEKTGMRVVSMITEPMAAILAFQQEHFSNQNTLSSINGLWMVVDTGAFFTSLTLVNVVAGLYTMIGSASFIGGGLELDQALSEHFQRDFEKKHGCKVNQKKALQKMTLACETTRKVLSTHTSSSCHVESFYEGMDYAGVVNRLRFETLARTWRSKWEANLDSFLADVDMDPFEIDRVLCVGGVLKTPRFIQVLQNYFGNAVVDTCVESDLAISLGTAIHSLQSEQHGLLTSKSPPATTPHLRYPLGLLNAKGDFLTLVPKFSPLPLFQHIVLEPSHQASAVCLKVAEGRELTPATTLSPEDEAENGPPFQDQQAADAPEDDGLEPIYAGTVLGECDLKLDAGIDTIDMVLRINTENVAQLSFTALHKATNEKQCVTLTL